MRKLIIVMIIGIAILGCKEEKSKPEITDAQLVEAFNERLAEAQIEAKEKKKKVLEPIPSDKFDDLIKDIERHKITDEDKAFFIGELKRAKSMVDGGIIGTGVKAVERIHRHKFISKRSKPKLIAQAKATTTQGLDSKNLTTKYKIIKKLQR